MPAETRTGGEVAMTRDIEPVYEKRTTEGLTHEMADMWMAGLMNADETTGPRWTIDQTKQVAAQRGIDHDPLDFWVAMNAEYSDRCKQYDKHGVNTIDMYVDGVMAFWLRDPDALPEKLALYFDYIVKH